MIFYAGSLISFPCEQYGCKQFQMFKSLSLKKKIPACALVPLIRELLAHISDLVSSVFYASRGLDA